MSHRSVRQAAVQHSSSSLYLADFYLIYLGQKKRSMLDKITWRKDAWVWLIKWSFRLEPIDSSLARRPKQQNRSSPCSISAESEVPVPEISHLQCQYVVERRQWFLWRLTLARCHIQCSHRRNQHNDKRSPEQNRDREVKVSADGWFTFRNPFVRFTPLPWINMGWKKTVSPGKHFRNMNIALIDLSLTNVHLQVDSFCVWIKLLYAMIHFIHSTLKRGSV